MRSSSLATGSTNTNAIADFNQFDLHSGSNATIASKSWPGFAIDSLPKTHGQGAPHVIRLVVPIRRQHSSCISSSLVPVSDTPP
jgi:hypothetical protein